SPELVVEEMNKKIDAGVVFLISPPLFDLSAIEPFMKRVDLKKAKIIPTVLLLKSLGMARYMMRNVDDVYVPESLLDRIQKSADKVRECILIASEMVSLLKQEGFSGVHIATLGWEHKLPEIIGRI
ncbi:MAG: methylenetetrahydrofolate reductase, partial [Desulfobacterales bacterium]